MLLSHMWRHISQLLYALEAVFAVHARWLIGAAGSHGDARFLQCPSWIYCTHFRTWLL